MKVLYSTQLKCQLSFLNLSSSNYLLGFSIYIMNNPFTSGRDIFTNIKKPQPKGSEENSITGPAANSADFNFRAEFRGGNKNIQQREQKNYTAQNTRESQKNIDQGTKNYSSNRNEREFQSNYHQNYAIKREQKIQRESANGNRRQVIETKTYIPPQQVRQKITFGKPQTSESANPKAQFQIQNFKYDRNRYQHDLSSDGSSFQNEVFSQSDNSQFKSKSRQPENIEIKEQKKMYNYGRSSNNDIYASQGASENIENRNKSMRSINMSPIVEHSQHKFDNPGDISDFMNLDNLGADIDKLLANSKNHEQLRRLLGMQDQIVQSNEQPQHNQSQSQYMMELQSKGFSKNQWSKNEPRPRDHLMSNKAQYMPNHRVNSPKVETYHSEYSQPSKNNNFATNYRKMEDSEPKYTPISSKKYEREEKQNDSHSYHEQGYPQEVFDYGQSNKNVPQVQRNQTKNISNDLQYLIDKQMKKIYWNGKNRIFLSASDRIETVKYNLEYI